MIKSGWGNFPKIEAESLLPANKTAVKKAIKEHERLIARGLGRSYGDSSLNDVMLDMTRLKHIIEFDKKNGIIKCFAGISLAELIDFILPHGWFIKVTPGTKFVSLGGAVSSDVHGKNHHLHGSFCETVLSLEVITADGQHYVTSKSEHSDLFKAVCGGMGLAATIVCVELQLLKVESCYINEQSIRTDNLKETMDILQQHKDSTYSVAWIDCLNKATLGGGIVFLGEHASTGGLYYKPSKAKSIPGFFPSSTLNIMTAKLFNKLMFWMHRSKDKQRVVSFDSFFYPLDALNNWNNLYGKNGFIQYQFVVPWEFAYQATKDIIQLISDSGQGAYLAVLKHFGRSNENYLSFPIEGITLAIDFKNNKKVHELLKKLDKKVLESGGRLYLAKDSRMSEESFKQMYPCWKEFNQIRVAYNKGKLFSSCQSRRLGL